MLLSIIIHQASRKLLPLFNIVLLLFIIQTVPAQSPSDTVKAVLLASLEKKAETRYVTRESNLVFPEMLKGSEEETLPYIEKFSNDKRHFLNKMYSRGKKYLPKAAAILKKYSVPEELKFLLILESEYNANAISPMGAVGFWQIMDGTAGAYGMQYIANMHRPENKNLFKVEANENEKGLKTAVSLRDDRRNFSRATHAAARYLRDSKKYLDNDWLLVVASYNCGGGNVRKAIRKSGKTDPTFWEVKNYLPSETRAYVMNFIALNVIFYNYDLFAENKFDFSTQKIMFQDDLEKNIGSVSSE